MGGGDQQTRHWLVCRHAGVHAGILQASIPSLPERQQQRATTRGMAYSTTVRTVGSPNHFRIATIRVLSEKHNDDPDGYITRLHCAFQAIHHVSD